MKLFFSKSVYFIFLVIACSENKTGIQGNNNSHNQVVIAENATIIKRNDILSFAPDTILNLLPPNAPIDRLKELFGPPQKIFPKSEDSKYIAIYYELDNCYILVHSIDNFVISSICIQSKKIEPYIKVGFGCPIILEENYLLLGKSKFSETFFEKNYLETHEIEIGRDRCDEFIVDAYFTGGPCSYHYVAYGSFIEYGSGIPSKESLNSKTSEEGSPFFENSLGMGTTPPSYNSTFDYIIVGEENAIKEHSYGEGVHCDFINKL